MVLRRGGQRSFRSDHPAAGVLPHPDRGGHSARHGGGDRRGVGCRHIGRTGQRHVGEDADVARRFAQPRRAAPVHPVRCGCRGAADGRRGDPRRVSGHRGRCRVWRLRRALGRDPGRRNAVDRLPGLDHRQPDSRSARAVPGHAGRCDAARRQPAAGHRPGEGRRSAGERLRRQRRRHRGVQPQCARRGEPGARRPTST